LSDPTTDADFKECIASGSYLIISDLFSNYGRIFHTDNYYTWIPLLLELRAMNIRICGARASLLLFCPE
jgi:hypothetical protein